MHHSYNLLSQSLRASVVQLHAPGNKNYCSARALREHILCFEFSPMKVLQIKFILFIFNVKYVPFLNFHKSLKLFEDNELVVYRNHLCLSRSENTCVEIHVHVSIY